MNIVAKVVVGLARESFLKKKQIAEEDKKHNSTVTL
jgi:hypothetical protein